MTLSLSWIQNLMRDIIKPCEDVQPYKQEIAYLKKQLSEFRLKDKGIDTTFVFDADSIKTIKAPDLYEILDTSFPGTEIKLNDNVYQYTSVHEVQKWASYDPTNEIPFRQEVADCDKFALTDMANFKSENNYQIGNAVFGIARGKTEREYHAWNICLAQIEDSFPEPDLFFLEPQSDEMWNVTYKIVHDYRPDFIYI